jgi:ABC-2 type transport system permease protein
MRAVLFTATFRADYLLAAAALDALWLAAGAAVFLIAFRDARHRGALLQMGE